MPYHPANAWRFPPNLRHRLSDSADNVAPDSLALLMQEALPRLSVRDLSVPTLLVDGQYERKFLPMRHWLETTHPKIAITDLPGGHSVNVDCHETFYAAAKGFLCGA